MDFLKYQPFAQLFLIYHTEELLNEINDVIRQDEKAIQAIKLIGKIPHRELQTWYNSADFIISGSHYEGGGIAVCEAMSCGCIPVITDIPSFRTMVGNCGLLYEPGNKMALLQVLLQTTGMNREIERGKVLTQFNNELSFEAIGGKLNAVIKSLL
jgi:glycosyltransferase involved in cell wall biosynthesis